MEGLKENIQINKRLVAVKNTRSITKRDLLFNDSCPDIEIDPETYRVTADGEDLTCEPLSEVPLAQRYFLF
jgi:urease subunit alpha